MSDLTERVARAIYEAWAIEENAETTWEDIVRMQEEEYPHAQKFYRMAFAEAKAAIGAYQDGYGGEVPKRYRNEH